MASAPAAIAPSSHCRDASSARVGGGQMGHHLRVMRSRQRSRSRTIASTPRSSVCSILGGFGSRPCHGRRRCRRYARRARHDVVDSDGRGEVAIAGRAPSSVTRIGARGGCATCRDADGRRRARERRACRQVDHLRIGRAIDRQGQRSVRPSRSMPRSSHCGRSAPVCGNATTGQYEGSFARPASSIT